MKRVFAALLCAVAFLLLPRLAEASSTDPGLNLVFVTGTHTESGAAARGSAPAPLLHVDQSFGRFKLMTEGIPPVGASIGGNSLGLQSVHLSYFRGLLGYRITDTTTVAAGEMIYNQQSTYGPEWPTPGRNGLWYTGGANEVDQSRVAGAEYTVSQTLRRTGRSSLDLRFSSNPHLSANLFQTAQYRRFDGSLTPKQTFVFAEAGSQIDTALTNTVQFHRTLQLQYGIRYLNMTMHFADGSLADRNSFIVPFVGITTQLGR